MLNLSNDALRSFVTLIELESYSKTAERLGKTQPAISMQIKKLEEQLALKLVTRDAGKVCATEHGKWLFQKASAMLILNDEIVNATRQTPLAGRLRLGIPNEFASTLLPTIVGEFNARYPNVSLEVHSALSRELLDSNNRRQFDVILALMSDEDLAATENAELVVKDDLVWVSDGRPPNLNDGLSLVVAPPGCMYRSRVIDALKQHTLVWRICYTHADLFGLVAAIKQGLGLTVLARTTLPSQLQAIRHASLPQLGHINVCMINQDSRHPAASSTLIEFIRQRCLQLVNG